MAQRKTVKELDAEVKGLRQELLRLKDEVAELKKAVWVHPYIPYKRKIEKCPCCGKSKGSPYDKYRHFKEE